MLAGYKYARNWLWNFSRWIRLLKENSVQFICRKNLFIDGIRQYHRRGVEFEVIVIWIVAGSVMYLGVALRRDEYSSHLCFAGGLKPSCAVTSAREKTFDIYLFLRPCETLWSAREIASIALSAEQARHTENVFHIECVSHWRSETHPVCLSRSGESATAAISVALPGVLKVFGKKLYYGMQTLIICIGPKT